MTDLFSLSLGLESAPIQMDASVASLAGVKLDRVITQSGRA
jgi:hypothetical protein